MNYTITFEEKDLSIIGNALANRPYGEVSQLIAKLNQDIQAQQPDQRFRMKGPSPKEPMNIEEDKNESEAS